MGWASGSMLMSGVIDAIEDHVSGIYEEKVKLFERLINEFEEMDCDTLDECRGQSEAYDEALDSIHPDD